MVKKDKKKIFGFFLEITPLLVSLASLPFSNDTFLQIVSILVGIVLLIDNKFQTNYPFTFTFRLIKAPFSLQFLLISFLGTISSIILCMFGGYNRPHHMVTNTAIIPLIIVTLFNHIKQMDEKEVFREFIKLNKNSLSKIQNTFFSICCSFCLAFMKIYPHHPASEIVDSINLVYIALAFYMITTCYFYIISFICYVKNEEIQFGELCPVQSVICSGYFFIAWGFIAFYSHEHSLEITYLLGIISYAVLAVSIFLISYFKSCSDKNRFKTLIVGLISILVVVLYGIVIIYLESIGYSATTEIQTFHYNMIIAIALIVVLIFLLIAFLFYIILYSNKANPNDENSSGESEDEKK